MWEKFSLQFESIDQIGIIPDGKQISDYENIQWMPLCRVYQKDCELILEYHPDKKPDKLVSCSLPVQQVNPEDFVILNIRGIPCVKLELSGKNIFVGDGQQEVSCKTTTLFFRACYQKVQFEELKSDFKKAKKNCM